MVYNVRDMKESYHNEFISLINRNSHNGKSSIIYFGNHEMQLPPENVDIDVKNGLMRVYHNNILIAVIDASYIYGVRDVII